MRLKIMVCGSIGYGGIDDIKSIYSKLTEHNFDHVDHIVGKGMDYSNIDDFRDKRELSERIVQHDLKYVKESDILIVLANAPSYGTAIEMFIAKSSGKKIILLAKKPVPTPWPISFSDYIVSSEEELFRLLYEIVNP